MVNEFVDYLNTLHNELAGNSNAVSEAQQRNPMFKKVEIDIDAALFLADRIRSGPQGCLIILTGHAGDGKTTILFQVLRKLKSSGDIPITPRGAITDDNGREIRYIKDYSEITRQERMDVFKEALDFADAGGFTILVANTGPLIETFKGVFSEQQDPESTIIECMDTTDVVEHNIYGHDFLILNVALLDNTDFIIPYAKKLVDPENYQVCQECRVKDACPIYHNASLVHGNIQSLAFIRDFYIWEIEHDQRATIRQISAHLAYSLTGAMNCRTIQSRVKKDWRTKYLFSNLLFGDSGNGRSNQAQQIRGTAMLRSSGIELKNTCKDYELFVQKNYCSLLPMELNEEYSNVDSCSERYMSIARKRAIMKRMMIVFAMDVDDLRNTLYKDLFSVYFPDYLKYRAGSQKPNNKLKKTILRALRIIFTGQNTEEGMIYLTLRRSGEAAQNVQMLVGRISPDDIELALDPVSVCVPTKKRCRLIMKYEGNKKTIPIVISLPLLNYFGEMANGMIVTGIDPLLSHGIESLKAQMLSNSRTISGDGNTVHILVQTDSGWQKKDISFEGGKMQ